jgi:hypothetical protein
VGDPREDVGLVPAEPEELRRREAGERPVPGELDEAGEADALLDLDALGPRALVVPEDRRPEHAAGLVKRDEAVHLPGEADAGYVAGAELGQGRLRRLHPVVRILLRPAFARRREEVLVLGPGGDPASGLDGERLDAGRADVEADDDGHSPPMAR